MGSFLSGVLMQNTSLLIVYAFSTLVLMAAVLPSLRIQFVSRQSPAGIQNRERIRDEAGFN
ncbi:hypothetical protein GXN76_00655 [Kroppenstedtia pulmonis]|uniref:Uncharacterized protein n=1 Tax=Kroppenstedtia pulmonis TaxID=1380685 RepID=A0A7D4BUH1_9BACL|nr:hypothetical protein [Kroppenstedtia pulmonis]QKG83113.1 hypothetical protein GXN76_00655 [Kroppenstedtia pulmonis]